MITWEDGENALLRIYTKDLKDEWTRIRRECQECPNKRFYKKYNKMRPVRNEGATEDLH